MSATTIIINNIGKKTANASGNFRLLKKRYTGNSIMLIKKDMSRGMMIIFPITSIAPIKKSPSNSMERFMLTGISFIWHIQY